MCLCPPMIFGLQEVYRTVEPTVTSTITTAAGENLLPGLLPAETCSALMSFSITLLPPSRQTRTTSSVTPLPTSTPALPWWPSQAFWDSTWPKVTSDTQTDTQTQWPAFTHSGTGHRWLCHEAMSHSPHPTTGWRTAAAGCVSKL